MKKLVILSLLAYGCQHAMQPPIRTNTQSNDILIETTLADSFMFPSPYFFVDGDNILYARLAAKTIQHYRLPRKDAVTVLTQLLDYSQKIPYKNTFDITDEFKLMHAKNPRLTLACLLQLITEEQKRQIQAFRYKEFVTECDDTEIGAWKLFKNNATPRMQEEMVDVYESLSDRKKFITAWKEQNIERVNEVAKRQLYPKRTPYVSLQQYLYKLMRFAMEENKAVILARNMSLNRH